MADIRHLPTLDLSNKCEEILPSLALWQSDSENEDRMIGSMFEGKYQIEQRLNQDSLGVTYRATHIFMEHSVAIKLLRCDRIIDNGLIDVFKREALAASRLDHENIISILDFGLTNNTLYLVMEYLSGQLLREKLIEQRQYDCDEVATILLQLCLALETAHKNGLIHQRLSPDNIFLNQRDNNDVVKVLDFGIAKLPLSDFSLKNGLASERLLRTPQYLSPEQCQGITPTHLSDIYSLGLIAFEMLTGRLPFQAANWVELADKKLKEEPPQPSSLNARVTPAMEEIILRMLAKNPQDRPRSAQHLIEELQDLTGTTRKKTGSLMMAACSNPDCKQLEPSCSGRCTNCQALLIGTMVRQRYEIRKMVGRGGFGSTYLVVDHDCFNEIRILKELLSNRSNNNANNGKNSDISDTAKRLFKREAQVLLNLQHPGIPKLYAYFIDEDCPYLVQDFIPGTTLSEELTKRDRLFAEHEAITTLTELAEILEYLHTRPTPVIHRDLKPQNIMRRIDGRLLIIDFGAVCRAANHRLDSPTLIGSPGYAPLEQIYGQPVPQSDLYAAGATIVCLLTGISPSELFDEKSQRLEWESHVKVSSQFASLLNDLLNPFIKKRLISASELKRRLQEINSEPIKVSAQLLNVTTGESLPVNKQENSRAALSPETVTAEKITSEKGNLRENPLPFLLQRLNSERFHGTLCLFNGESAQTLNFRAGNLLFDGVNEESYCEKIFPLFQWLDGSYQIKAKEISLGSDYCENFSTINTANLILAGIRAMDNLDQIRSWFADIKQEIAITSLEMLDQSIKLKPSEVFIASRIEKKTTIEGLLSLSGFTEDELLKTTAILLTIGLVYIVEQPANSRQTPAQPSQFDQKQSNNNEKILKQGSKTTLPNDLDYYEAATFCYEIESLYNRIEVESHYAVLGVAPTDSEAEIREAYAQLAQRFHTDKVAQLADYHSDLREKLIAVTRRLTDAIRVLTDSRLRKDYDQQLRDRLKRKPLIVTTPHSIKPVLQCSNNKNRRTQKSSIVKSPVIDQIQPIEEPIQIEIDPKGIGSWVNPQSADILYRNLIESDKQPIKSRVLNDQQYYEHSLSLLAVKEYKQAIAAIYRAINLSPKQARYWQQLGDIYNVLPDGQKRAEQAYNQARRLKN